MRTCQPRVIWSGRPAWPNRRPACSIGGDGMELAIQKLAALNMLVMGLSHVFQHRVWAEFFIHWREKGAVGVFYNAILHFAFGSLIVAFHNVWYCIPVVLTLAGWAWTMKG